MTTGNYKLMSYLPLWILSIFNSFPEILPVVVGVLACRCLCFFPYKARFALKCLPVKLDKLAATGVRDESEGVHTEAIHVSVRTDDTVACHGPEKGMQRAGLTAEEIPSSIMGGSSLRNLAVLLRFDGMN